MLLDGTLPPWSSRNVWDLVVNEYAGRPSPNIVEFGTGASTQAHLRNLVSNGRGTYQGIEKDPTWFSVTCGCVPALLMSLGVRASLECRSSEMTGVFQEVSFRIVLREAQEAYVGAVRGPADVVIVDGDHRKDCVDRVLDHDLLAPDGVLALMEAGRGRHDWWEGPLSGEDDYSPQVERMLALGAEIVHGNGVDRWPGCPRRSPWPVNRAYPWEMCILRKNGGRSGELETDTDKET